MAVAFVIGIIRAAQGGNVDIEVADSVFRDVTSDLAENFSLNSLDLSLTSRKKPAYAYFRRPEPEIVIDTENSNNIAMLLCHCLTSKLDNEIDRIIVKLTGEMETVDVNFFEAIYLPFLKVLLAKLVETDTAVQDPRIEKLFQHTLVTYLARFVKAEPKSTKDWAQQGVSCNCQDCQRLNAFLISPDQKVGRFALAKNRRAHLHSKLENSGCKRETDRRGNPQTLVVTKTNSHYKAAHKAWEERCRVARKHLAKLSPENLRDFLGSMYDPIMSLSPDVLAPTANSTIPQSAAALASNANTSNRGVLPPISRRKVPQVIVLDDD
jgi:hypothetical protein